MTDGSDNTTTAERDAAVIREIRRLVDARGTVGETWSLRLTLGEIDALLRAVDDRDDLKRRLIGEWEGDLPEPRPAVTIVSLETWPCHECGDPIRRRFPKGQPVPVRELGRPYYEHVGEVDIVTVYDHDAVRGPNA